MTNSAMFAGLVADEQGNPAEVGWVGSNACYIVYDDDFKKHIDASQVDRQVLRKMQEQVQDHREIAVDAMLEALGKDDLFTKAALENSINKMDETVGQPIPEDARQWLGMLGFRITIDTHGDVIDIQMPSMGADGGDDYL